MNTDAICIDRDTLGNLLDLLLITPRVHKPECEMDRAIKALREALAGKLAQLPVPEQKESDDHAGAE
jgi:hypothetical protein